MEKKDTNGKKTVQLSVTTGTYDIPQKGKNEDFSMVYQSRNGIIYLLADGNASDDFRKEGNGRGAVKVIDNYFNVSKDQISDIRALERAVHEINDEVYNSFRGNVGSTLTGFLRQDKFLYPFAVGDSPFLIKDNGKIRQLFDLDVVGREEAVQRLKNDGIQESDSNYEKYVKTIMKNTLSKGIGKLEGFELKTLPEGIKVTPGMRIGIFSDGVTDNLMLDNNRYAGTVKREDAPRIYRVMESSNVEDAVLNLGAEMTEEEIERKTSRSHWKKDDATGLFVFFDPIKK